MSDFFKALRKKAVVVHNQYGFTWGKSCLTNLTSFYDKVTHLVDQRKLFFFCNFIKALGAVSHSVFLHKLFITHLDKFPGHGVSKGLSGGAQGVIVNGATSAWQSVTSTVPHDSVLGPVLFSVFINYPDTGIKYSWRKFAGKQELWHLQGQRSLQRDLESWIVSHHRKFSKGKCHILRLGWDDPGCLSGHQ